ncbi:hypothetical protein PR001_g25243 [Phytophthora rubi]|uniref:Uncharacterized protein n=1 Tax=Phytophthora rubi TaxID=129364 RepID=A0A6A3IDM8_9STRA|nr:hypothetical protein PR001_g25243 [Phytophthora rubi]KAE8978184.1 hypothetical protein PR002_g24790 [Phytophthora rubi]
MFKEEWEMYDRNVEDKTVEAGSLRCTFVMEPMILDFGEMGMPAEYVDLVMTLVRENVWFSQVSFWTGKLGTLYEDAYRSMLTFGNLMMTLFNTPRRPRQLANATMFTSDGEAEKEFTPLQLGTIHLSCDYALSHRDFQSMCSAIVTNQTAKNVFVYLKIGSTDDTTGAEQWRWIAYAFFSKRARENSAFERLAFTSINDMTVEDMEGFSAIVASEHPEEDLCGTPRGLVEEREAKLIAGSEIHWDIDDQGEPRVGSSPITPALPISSVRTFSDDGESQLVNVMIPGFGHCQVQRRDLVFAQTNLVRASSRGVTSLTLSFTSENEFGPDGLLPFLAAVGWPLKFLSLKESYLQLDDRMIFQCCPNLDELALCRYRLEARLNFRDYRGHHQQLPELGCDWDEVLVLLTRLSDNSSPLAQCVRRLRLQLFSWTVDPESEANGPTSEDEINAIQRMLEMNKSLEYLDIIAPAGHCANLTDFRTYHLKSIMRPLKLPTETKIAVLSVLKTGITK